MRPLRSHRDANQRVTDGMTDDFKEIIWNEDSICRNCYRTRYEVYERKYWVHTEDGDLVTDPVRDMVREIGPEERHYIQEATQRATDDRPTHGVTGACVCGAVRPTTLDRPMSRRTALIRTTRACRHYYDAEIDIDVKRAVAHAAYRLRDPAVQHRQDAEISIALEASR